MYGLNEKDLIQVQKKFDVQKDYLNNHYFVGESGQVKSLLDVSFSANHSKRYYAEIINKINTMNELVASETVEYESIFLTVTLDGFYRDFLKGKFSRYNELKHSKDIPNNERFGFLKDKIEKKETFSIKDLYNILNFQLNRFQKSNIFKRIKEDGYKKHYIRVAEPHKKDGVPHLHFMLYVPKEYLYDLKQFYIKYFSAPQNIKSLLGCDDGQLNGFQWKIESAPAYILKYIFKSFRNVQDEEEIDYLQAWYIKNRILRVVTSHSLIPAWVYRKIMPLEMDWHYLTDIKNNATCEWSKEDDYFRFEDEENRVLEYNQGIYKIIRNDKIIKEFGTKRVITKKRISKNKDFSLDDLTEHFEENNIKSHMIKDSHINLQSINKLDSYTLINKYNLMKNDNDFNFSLELYCQVQNELIERKLIVGEIQEPKTFNTDFIFNDSFYLEYMNNRNLFEYGV